MADIIHVSTEELRSAVQSYTNCKQQLQTAYLQMSNAVRTVDASWNGDASETFKNQFDAMYKNMEQTEAKVQDAIDELTKTAEIFDDKELTTQNAFSSLDVGTSPFNV